VTAFGFKTFIPEVKRTSGKHGKIVLLIINNAPSHPSGELLEHEGGTFRVMFCC
jgi:hypothetical protein